MNNIVVMKYIRGSHLYGTNVETSDTDFGGIFKVPNEDWLSLNQPPGEESDEKHDVCYYELRKYLTLAMTANPTVIEGLFVPDEFIIERTSIYDELIKHRDMFVTRQCYWALSGYAYAQIKRAKGKNKKVNEVFTRVNQDGLNKLVSMLMNGELNKECVQQAFCSDFVRYLTRIGYDSNKAIKSKYSKSMQDLMRSDNDIASMLPKDREDFCYRIVDVQHDHGNVFQSRGRKMSVDEFRNKDIVSIENVPGMFRLYTSEKDRKSVFNNGELTFDSIPIERENSFVGLMSYNRDGYERERAAYLSFWEWMANRNEERWKTQDNREIDYDPKNMSHTVRLLLEADNILCHGRPIIRFDGDKLQFLRDIRAGKFEYEYLVKFAETECDRLKKKYDESVLPHKCNHKEVNALYKKLIMMEE